MEIKIVEFFQNFACGFCDVFFWIITKMGEESFFLFMLLGVYLCYSKKFAIKYSIYYLLSVGINNLTKIVLKRPRPYVVSDKIKNRLPATGMSFPSGHTQGYCVQASTIFCEVNARNTGRLLKRILVSFLSLFAVLVMISRIYWGQHYLSDVCVGMLFGIALPFLFDWLLHFVPFSWRVKVTEKIMYIFLVVVSVMLFVLFLIIDLSIGFYSRKVYKFLGVFLAMGIGYFVDDKFIKYTSNQGWKIGILKFLISIIVISGLYWIISFIVPIVSFVYFLVYLFLGLIATIVLPLFYNVVFRKRGIYGKGHSE